MSKTVNALIAVALVYGFTQVTIGSLMTARINDFAAELAATAPDGTGRIGPIALRSSDICTQLTDPGGWRGTLSRFAFIEPGRAADALTARYRFSATGGCTKYGINRITAEPRGT